MHNGSQELVDRWQKHFRGELLAPHHEKYGSARRIWNGMIDRQPALIARCTCAEDVRAAVQLANEALVSTAVYANHMTSDESADRVRAAYGDAKYKRLSELKAKYDPLNLFSQNHNILPAP